MQTGREIRAFGADLALTYPAELFMAHEWIKRTHLRPQFHAHAWLGAVIVFGPLFYHHDDLCEEVICAMLASEDADMDNEEMDVEVASSEGLLVDVTPTKANPSRKANKMSATDDDSVATAPAGAANLHQQKISGNDRKRQIQYDVKFFVPPPMKQTRL
jgi:hypothetical protein